MDSVGIIKDVEVLGILYLFVFLTKTLSSIGRNAGFFTKCTVSFFVYWYNVKRKIDDFCANQFYTGLNDPDPHMVREASSSAFI